MSMLAERKRKTRYVINPTKKPLWTTDSEGIKFGKELMEKMGWSIGKGLGAREQGIQQPLHVSYKNDNKGMGYKGNEENWIEYQSEFNSLLNQLSNNIGNVETNEPEKRKIMSLEEKSKHSKARVHYQKFTKGKDLSNYSEHDLSCILGTNKFKKDDTAKVIKKDTSNNNKFETVFGVTTINGGSSADYFKKIWSLNSSKSENSNAEKSANGFNEEQLVIEEISAPAGMKSKKNDEETMQECLNGVEDENIEKQTKRHKRKRKLDSENEIPTKKKRKDLDKIKSEKNENEFNSPADASNDYTDHQSKKKKKKKKEFEGNGEVGPPDQENQIAESPFKKKKNKKELGEKDGAENSRNVAEDQQNGSTNEGSTKKKKKREKRVEELTGIKMVDPYTVDELKNSREEETTKKKKKKGKVAEFQGELGNNCEIQTVEQKSDFENAAEEEVVKKKKNKKEKKDEDLQNEFTNPEEFAVSESKKEKLKNTKEKISCDPLEVELMSETTEEKSFRKKKKEKTLQVNGKEMNEVPTEVEAAGKDILTKKGKKKRQSEGPPETEPDGGDIREETKKRKNEKKDKNLQNEHTDPEKLAISEPKKEKLENSKEEMTCDSLKLGLMGETTEEKHRKKKKPSKEEINETFSEVVATEDILTKKKKKKRKNEESPKTQPAQLDSEGIEGKSKKSKKGKKDKNLQNEVSNPEEFAVSESKKEKSETNTEKEISSDSPKMGLTSETTKGKSYRKKKRKKRSQPNGGEINEALTEVEAAAADLLEKGKKKRKSEGSLKVRSDGEDITEKRKKSKKKKLREENEKTNGHVEENQEKLSNIKSESFNNSETPKSENDINENENKNRNIKSYLEEFKKYSTSKVIGLISSAEIKMFKGSNLERIPGYGYSKNLNR